MESPQGKVNKVGQRLWTTAEDEQLRHYADLGWSAKKIGDFIGRSRNSIIGRSHRLKVKLWKIKGGSSTRQSSRPTPPISTPKGSTATSSSTTTSRKMTGLGLRWRGY